MSRMNGKKTHTHTHNRATEHQGRSSLRSRCTVNNNVEFSVIKVAVRYIQYIAYTVLIEMMQIV